MFSRSLCGLTVCCVGVLILDGRWCQEENIFGPVVDTNQVESVFSGDLFRDDLRSGETAKNRREIELSGTLNRFEAKQAVDKGNERERERLYLVMLF